MQLRQQVLWFLFLQEVAAIKRAARDRRGRLGARQAASTSHSAPILPRSSPEHMERTLDLLARRVVGRVLLKVDTRRSAEYPHTWSGSRRDLKMHVGNSAITRGEIAPGVLFSPSITVRK